MPRYIIAACRNAPMANDPDFPVCVAYFDQPTRLEALREAHEFFGRLVNSTHTHLRVVDGPSE